MSHVGGRKGKKGKTVRAKAGKSSAALSATDEGSPADGSGGGALSHLAWKKVEDVPMSSFDQPGFYGLEVVDGTPAVEALRCTWQRC